MNQQIVTAETLSFQTSLPPTIPRVAGYHVYTHHNEYFDLQEDPYNTWEAILAAGRRYLVGEETPMTEFIREHRSLCTGWQKQAFLYCWAYPAVKLVFDSFRLYYTVQRRGEFVEIGLPHHDQGGEKHWVTRDGRAKILVNHD